MTGTQDGRGTSLRAMSFNVRVARPSDGDDAWAERRGFVASTIRVHRADLVGLQEALSHQFDYLREALPAYEWAGVGRVDGDREGEFVPVGYRRDRFEREDGGSFWLSETPEVPGSVGWDASHPRVATWVRLRDRASGLPLLFVNAHLDHEGTLARREGARLLVDRAVDLAGNDPIVVTGDFNATPDSEPYRILTGALADARRDADRPPHGPEATFHGFDGDPDLQIDYVFVSGFDARQHAILPDRERGRYPSDHFPVVADLVADGRPGT